MKASSSAAAKRKSARELERHEKSVAALRKLGELDSRVWVKGCGRCGGDIVVHAYAVQTSTANGSCGTDVKALPLCQVCRVDRVKRWGDLMQASAYEGKELRDPFSKRGTARILAAEGLVRYNNQDFAWELTPAGLDLLRRYDAPEEP